MARNVDIVVGDTPVLVSSVPEDARSGQSIFVLPVDGTVKYGYRNDITFAGGVHLGVVEGGRVIGGTSKFLQPGEQLWLIAAPADSVTVAIDEQGI